MTSKKHLLEVGQPVGVVEVYIFYGDELLMFKRSENKKKFPGFWSLPGGHIDEGENPLAAAIREVKEETGIQLVAHHIHLRVVASHHHIDRDELYLAFAFAVELQEKQPIAVSSIEGEAFWVQKSMALTMPNVFAPIKYYFNHVLNNQPGIMYTMSQWSNSQLVRVLSETIEGK